MQIEQKVVVSFSKTSLLLEGIAAHAAVYHLNSFNLSVLNPDTRLSWRFTLFGQLLLHLNTNIRASLAFLFPWLL